MFSHNVSIATTKGGPQSSDTVTVTRLDEDSRGIRSSDYITDEGTTSDRGRLLVRADGDLVQAGEIDEDTGTAQVELASRPAIAAVLREEGDVVFGAVFDLSEDDP